MIEEILALENAIQRLQTVLVDYQQQTSVLYALEARYTLFHVHRLLQNKNNASLDKTLENFLKTRWERIQHTDAQYFHDAYNPANLMCIKIAKMLGRLHKQAYLLFLIPTLRKVSADAYISSSYEDMDLKFNHVILSDDNTRILHIPDVLEFAEQDGVLKHASLFDGRRQDLSVLEESRLLARHVSVEHYYHAIRDKINFQLYGETAGAYLARLILGLRAGGAHGSGSEMLTGSEANVAIADFSMFLETLSQAKKDILLNACKFDRWLDNKVTHVSIGQSWKLLQDPSQTEEGKEQAITYCVELIAHTLEEILQENPMLYQVMAFEEGESRTLASFEDVVKQSKKSMLRGLNASRTHRYYGEKGDDKLASAVFIQMGRDRAFHLTHAEVAYVARCYHGDHVALSNASESILLHTRDYMSPSSLQTALKNLPREIVHDVEVHILSKNKHPFFCSPKRPREEESEVLPELLNKKQRIMHPTCS